MLPALKKSVVVLFFIGLVAVLYGLFSNPHANLESDQDNTVTSILSNGENEKYARVLTPRDFTFPDDHGPHNTYKTEWWYFTGNLDHQNGRKFGYELTFFRFALSPDKQKSTSPWRSNQMYMAHFALTDVENEHFQFFERYSREALGLAGAMGNSFRVWLFDWSVARLDNAEFTLKLQAKADDITIDLTLTTRKPVVLQGQMGFSRKSSAPGQASYYYSFTRLSTKGTIQLNNQVYPVSGTSWMDHEWSTSALSEDQAGWDWFALQFDDGRELMFFRFRRKDGTVDRNSAGTLVNQDGTTLPLPYDAVIIQEQRYWKSPHSKAVYPSKWRLSLPQQNLELTIEPLMAEQELYLDFKYWEGAVTVSGRHKGRILSGRGYVELTGYANSEK